MNTKRMLGLVLVIAVVGFFAWKTISPKPIPQAPAAPTAPTTSALLGATKNAKGDFEYKSETPYVRISAEFPTRPAVESTVKDIITQFQKDTNEQMLSAGEKARLQEQGRKYSLDVTYEEHTSPGFVSDVFTVYEDTGGAHPNSFSYAELPGA